MTPEIVLQQAIRERLAGDAAILAYVPAASILDRNERPAPTPSIILGEAQAVDEGAAMARNRLRVYLDAHVWVKEPSLKTAKMIAGAIRLAIRSGRPVLPVPFHCADCFVSAARFLRDPDGETSHGVVSISALVQEAV